MIVSGFWPDLGHVSEIRTNLGQAIRRGVRDERCVEARWRSGSDSFPRTCSDVIGGGAGRAGAALRGRVLERSLLVAGP